MVEPAITTANTRNTIPGDETARIAPATAGPASAMPVSIQPMTTFAAVSSSGRREISGRRTACVGRVSVTAVAAIAESA